MRERRPPECGCVCVLHQNLLELLRNHCELNKNRVARKCLPSHLPELSKVQRKTWRELWKHPLLFLVIFLTTPRKEFYLSRFPLSRQMSIVLGSATNTAWSFHDPSHTAEESALARDCQSRLPLMPTKTWPRFLSRKSRPHWLYKLFPYKAPYFQCPRLPRLRMMPVPGLVKMLNFTPSPWLLCIYILAHLARKF